MKDPLAFDTIGVIQSYWNNNGKFNKLSTALAALVPDNGPVAGKNRKALDKYRKAANCYYDLYNNGLCNRASEFYHAFGFSGLTSTAESIEEKLSEIILEAAAEQLAHVKQVQEVA